MILITSRTQREREKKKKMGPYQTVDFGVFFEHEVECEGREEDDSLDVVKEGDPVGTLVNVGILRHYVLWAVVLVV